MSLPHDTGSSSGGFEATAFSPTFKTAPERLGGHKHFSIDLSLELERQLELEGSSPPTTPSASESSHGRSYIHAQPNSDTLDPQILVHIITGLRKTVEDITKERDDLIKLFESSTTREATLQDTLALMTEKATDYEEELSAAKKKMKEDEEAISLLRNKVEESRRGIMRLQAESRRQSAVPSALDLSRSAIPGISSPPLSKRASFTPLTGRANNHRRVSSISSAGDGNGLGLLHLLSSDTQPFSSQDSSTASGLGPPGSRRSLFFRNSPPKPETIPLPPTNAPTSSEVEAMKKELESLKRELADARIELSEANEAKEASDSCVKALREFIADNQVGESSSAGKKWLPPPIATSDEDGSDKKSTAFHSGWGFKLWKADSSMALSARQPSPPPPPPSSTTTTTSAPFSRLGGFFSSRASAALTTIPSSSGLQTNAALTMKESFLDSSSGHSSQSISDESSSSVVEPGSPAHDEEHSVHVKVVDVNGAHADGLVGGDDEMVGKDFGDKSGDDDTARIQPGVVMVVV